jgi:hypothetical protein
VSVLPYGSLLGLTGLVATIALSFEEAHTGMLVLSGILLASAPLGLLVHLASTSELTRVEKHLWLRALAGSRGPRFAAAYFRAGGRHSATQALLRAAGRLP